MDYKGVNPAEMSAGYKGVNPAEMSAGYKGIKRNKTKGVNKLIEKVIKRDGTITQFSKDKIIKAVFKAGYSTHSFGKEVAELITNIVVTEIEHEHNGTPVNIEVFQNKIEQVLMRKGFYETAKAFIIYREKRRELRELKTHITPELLEEYLSQGTWEVHENANVDYSIQGLKAYVAGKAEEIYWLEKVYPKGVSELHKNGWIHIHNLSFLGAYCVGWDLEDLIKRGFGGVPGKPYSSPAKHLSAVLGQMMNFLFTLQNEAAGAVAFSSFDTLLAPFVRYDKLSYKDVKQQIQEFVYNMNQTMRTGGQSPFSNITLDISPNSLLGNKNVVIGGVEQSEKYGDFQEEMNLINRAFWETMLEGDGHGRPFTFPIPTLNVDKNFPWDSQELETMWDATAKFGIPYFANYINSDLSPDDARSMCFTADTRLIYKEGKHNRYQRTTIRSLVNNWNPQKEFSLLINGKWVKITDAFKLKNNSEKIIKVELRNGEIVKMTPDHPAMIIENGKLKQVLVKNLKVGDFIPIAKNTYEGGSGDFELGRWLGLYVSEGGINKNEVYFSFNENEKELQEFVKKVAEERFAFSVRVTKDPRWQTIQVWVKSKSAVEWVRKFCSGEKALQKRLLSSLYGMSKDFRFGSLVGIFQGDGYERDIELNTTNRKLRDDIADLAKSIGINYIKRTNPDNTKEGKKFTSYILRLCRDNLKEFSLYFKNVRSSTSSIYKDFGDFYGIKIKLIKVQNYHASVYDFEVDSKEHLFQLANGVITHNCCRLKLDIRELKNKGGGLFGANPLTGSVGVITINLPRIGYLSKNEEDFFNTLSEIMDSSKEALESKRKTVEQFTEMGLYPYSKIYLDSVKKTTGNYWDNHFSTIGIIGMNEAIANFIGENMTTPQGTDFAIKVMNFMRDRLTKYQEETEHMFNLEATPAESTAYSLALKDRKEYPDIITAGTNDNPYYTNSTQLPVGYTDDPFEAASLQNEVQSLYTGGTVLHFFLGERLTYGQYAKVFVKKIIENFKLPYITLTPTFSICPKHGYIAGEHEFCPYCDEELVNNIKRREAEESKMPKFIINM